MHKESHQYIDVVRMMKPVTKWNARVHDAEIIPEAVRKAFAVAEREKPGATHLELPADVMEAPPWTPAPCPAQAPGAGGAGRRPSCTAPPSCCRRPSAPSSWRATASSARTHPPRCAASASRPGST